MTAFAAIVLAGGAARRLGGAAKPELPIGGVPLLVRVLAAVPDASARIVVGPATLDALLPGGTLRTVEDPPGGGPVAGLAAGLARLPPTDPMVAVLAADLPFLHPGILADLRAALEGPGPPTHTGPIGVTTRPSSTDVATQPTSTGWVTSRPRTITNPPPGRDGALGPPGLAVLADPDGRPQWLCSVWRTTRLLQRLADLGDPWGRSMRDLVDGVPTVFVDAARHHDDHADQRRNARGKPTTRGGPTTPAGLATSGDVAATGEPDRPGTDGVTTPGEVVVGHTTVPVWFDCDTEEDIRRAEEWARGDA